MRLRHWLLAAALCLAGAAAHAQGFSDTNIGVRDAPFTSNPGGEKGSRDVNKVIVNLGHFDVWAYGSNFFNADVLLSNPNEPALNSTGGSTEFYGVYRGQLSPDKIFGLNTHFGPIQAINFEFGGDLETENTAFAPNKKLLIVGPNFHFNLPDSGFLDVGVHFSKEWNHNGFSDCPIACGRGGPVSFDPAWEFEFVWLQPLPFAGLPIDFRGFMNVVGPKGTDGFGNDTYIEILARPQIQLDVGKLIWGHPHKPDVYLAVEFWEHKFGNSTQVSGSEEVTPLIGAEWHF